MREIEFRGKRVDDGKWVYGYYWAHHDQGAQGSVYTDHFITPFSCYEREQRVVPETVGQYTGFKDNNEVKIFEGDEVEYDNGTKARVVFKEGGFCGYDEDTSSSDEAYLHLAPQQESPFDPYDFEVEVTGNIHGNK